MGLMDNFRKFFSNFKNTPSEQSQQSQFDTEYEKSRLATRIVDLVDRIKRINSFDSSVWHLSNVSSYELKRKSLDELKRVNSTLEKRLSELERQRQSRRNDPTKEALEVAKWTGEKLPCMSDVALDRLQRDDR